MELCLRLWLQYLKVSNYLCALSGFYINWEKKKIKKIFLVFASKGCKCKHKQISYFTHEHYVEVFLPHCVLLRALVFN